MQSTIAITNIYLAAQELAAHHLAYPPICSWLNPTHSSTTVRLHRQSTIPGISIKGLEQCSSPNYLRAHSTWRSVYLFSEKNNCVCFRQHTAACFLSSYRPTHICLWFLQFTRAQKRNQSCTSHLRNCLFKSFIAPSCFWKHPNKMQQLIGFFFPVQHDTNSSHEHLWLFLLM